MYSIMVCCFLSLLIGLLLARPCKLQLPARLGRKQDQGNTGPVARWFHHESERNSERKFDVNSS
jgi:hypothetical protein